MRSSRRNQILNCGGADVSELINLFVATKWFADDVNFSSRLLLQNNILHEIIMDILIN